MDAHRTVYINHLNNEATGGITLLEFLFEIYTKFTLESSPLETFIGPRDELAILKLILSNHLGTVNKMLSQNELQYLWLGVCCRRLELACSTSSIKSDQFLKIIINFLHSSNVIDRVHILTSITKEFTTNIILKETIFKANFIIESPELTWFEWQVVRLLLEVHVPSIIFAFSGNRELPFYKLHRLCRVVPERFVKSNLIERTLLAYLAVAVNIRDTIDLAFIINRPPRGFGRSFFSSLRRIADKTSILPGQLVMSFPACVTESSATTSVQDDGRLRSYSVGLKHLADTIRGCQDALSGFVDEENGSSVAMATTCTATSCMSPKAAFEAVTACFKALQRVFMRPLPPSGQASRRAAPFVSIWAPSEIKAAKMALLSRLQKLIDRQSAHAVVLTPTPNRSSSNGGSIQGRAAFKLARLLLVSEAIIPATKPDSSEGAVSPPPPQLIRCGSECFERSPTTPFTENVLSFFVSPTIAERTPSPSLRVVRKRSRVDVPLSPVGNSEDGNKPLKALNARYQSDLDWALIAAEPPSPVVGCRFSSIRCTPELSNGATCASIPSVTNVLSRSKRSQLPSSSALYRSPMLSCERLLAMSEDSTAAATLQNIREPSCSKRCPKKLFVEPGDHAATGKPPAATADTKQITLKRKSDLGRKVRNSRINNRQNLGKKTIVISPHQRTILGFVRPA